MNEVVFKTLKEKDFIVKNYLFKVALELELSPSELILLIFFMNQEEPVLNIKVIKAQTYLTEEQAMNAFQKLVGIGLVDANVVKAQDGTYKEIISVDNMIKQVTTDITKAHIESVNSSIFDKFEKELGRPLSPFEFEKINIWIANNVPEEMIEAALKEAVYNDAKSLNYIEKIIYNWQTRGYKSVKDVNTGIKKEAELEKTKELFDYNWLDGE